MERYNISLKRRNYTMTEDQRRRNRKQLYRRKRRRRRIKLLLCFLVLAIPTVTVGILIKNQFGDQIRLVGMGMTNEKVRQVMSRSEQYPDELLELLADNEETVDFVLDYPEKKDAAPAETVGDVVKGQIPLLLQWDERWGYAIYGDDMIAVNGCGPTTISMVAAGLTGDNTITPYKVAQFSAENGYYAGDSGTSWALMTEGAQQFGIYGEELGLSEGEIYSALESGHPIICSMKPGDFTTTGHFIVLTGTEAGKIRVNDPNSRIRSEKLWDYSTLEYQINNLWAYSLI
jgi:hypothetical protein